MKTRLYYNGRLMNEITFSSRFKTMPKQKYDTREQREEAARIQMDGWVQNAGYDISKFRIEHDD